MGVYDTNANTAAHPLGADTMELRGAEDATRAYTGMGDEEYFNEANVTTLEMEAITVPADASAPAYSRARPERLRSFVQKGIMVSIAAIGALSVAYLTGSFDKEPVAPGGTVTATSTTVGQELTTLVPTTIMRPTAPETTVPTLATTPVTREAAPVTTIAEPRLTITIPDVQKIIQEALTQATTPQETTTTAAVTTTTAKATTTTQATTSTTRPAPTTTTAVVR